jgi:hypothetical protein
MNGEDWTSYEFQLAPRNLLCLFRRTAEAYNKAIESPHFSLANWRKETPRVAYARDFPPEFNISGLEWKLTGIAREELDRMPLEVRRQVMPLSASCGWAQGLSANSGLFAIGAMDGVWPGQIFG